MVLILLNQKQFCLHLHCNGIESYLQANKARILKLRSLDYIPPYYLSLKSASKDFIKDEIKEITLNHVIFDFSIVFSLIDIKMYLIFMSI